MYNIDKYKIIIYYNKNSSSTYTEYPFDPGCKDQEGIALMTIEEAGGEQRHFLISYTDIDKPWAEWIGVQLERYGYKTVLRAWDIRPGQNWVLEMDDAIKRSKRTLLVVTRAYLVSDAFVEWAEAFRRDPRGNSGRVLPVRVESCHPGGLLGSLETIDLFHLPEHEAAHHLLEGVLQTRGRPSNAAYPGPSSQLLKVPEEHFREQVRQIEYILQNGDYDAAFATIDGLLRQTYHDYLPRQRARLLFLQGLVILRGRRPRHLTGRDISNASKLLAQARREYPLRVYAATLAAVENDFASTGLSRSRVNPEALLAQSRQIQPSAEDREPLEMVRYTQPELYQIFRSLF